MTADTLESALATKPLWGDIKIPVLGVSGEKGSGKSLFISSIRPNRTAMIDLEESSVSYNIPFAKRWNLYEEMLLRYKKTPKPIEVFLWFKETVENIKPGEFDVLGIDPITDVEQGMVDWVKENPAEFGRTKAQYEKASGLVWGDVKSYWKMMLGIISAKVQTFAFTAHMGAVWKGNQPTGRRAPKGKETLFELASLYLQLERKPDEKGHIPEIPTAIVLKSRLAITSIDDDGNVDHHPILPPRMPVANPAAIRNYIKNPPNYKKLKKEELAPPELLTDDDKLLIQQEIANAELEREQLANARLERMKESQDEQQRRREQMAAKAAEAVKKPESTPAASGNGDGNGKHEAKTSANGNVSATASAKTEDPPFEPNKETAPRSDLKHAMLIEIIQSQFRKLNLTDKQIEGVIKKRGVERLEDFTLDQAQELETKMAEKLAEISENEITKKH